MSYLNSEVLLYISPLFFLPFVLPQLIGHTTINWTLGIFPAAIVGIAIVCEPIGASLLAVILLDEIPTLFEMVGALIIVSGVYIAIRNRAVVSNDKKMCI